MEDSSSSRPVSVESASFKESISLFEEEVISNKLILVSLTHSGERIVLSSEFNLEAVASLNNLLLDLVSLCLGNSWTKREFSQVSSDSDSSTDDHGSVFSWEWRALKFLVVHVTNMFVSLLMSVILFNHWVEHGAKSSV